MMRILLTTHQFFPEFVSGTEVLTYSVARELIRLGHKVRVLTGYPGSSGLAEEARFDEYEFNGIHVYRFHHAYTSMGGQVSMIEVGYNNRLGADYFGRILESFEPDLVHFFHLNRLGTGLIERAVQANVPRFMTITDFWTVCPTGQLLLPDGKLCAGPSAFSGNCLKHFLRSTQEGLIKKSSKWLPTPVADLLVWMTKKGVLPIYPKKVEVAAIADRLPINISRLNQLNAIVVPSEFMKEFLIRHRVKADLITKANFGVDITSPSVKVSRKINRGALRIGYIGTLAPHKGCHVLIDAFKALPGSKAKLKIFGSADGFPDYMTKLHSLVIDYPSIEFCETFPNSDIGKVLADLDVLVVPSVWYENTPLVLHSAQAARCPVIASDLPGLAELIVHGNNGLLFQPGNSADLARQLSRLIGEENLLRQLSSQAFIPKSTSSYVDDLLRIWRIGQ